VPGGNLAEGSPLVSTQKIVEKQRNYSKSGIEWLYKNPKSPENTPNSATKQQSTETKRM